MMRPRWASPTLIVPMPLSTNTHGYIAPAEPPHLPRGMTKGPTRCGGCGEKDPEPKLKVDRMPPYHPDCYQTMMQKWPSDGSR